MFNLKKQIIWYRFHQDLSPLFRTQFAQKQNLVIFCTVTTWELLDTVQCYSYAKVLSVIARSVLIMSVNVGNMYGSHLGMVFFTYLPLVIISRGSGLILACPCIRVRPSWADKTSVLPLFQWSQTGITVGVDTVRVALHVAYGIIFFFCSDDEKMTYEITIEML